MNPAKKNNGWILCPSKSFPGKFYYFNVINGETAWSLNEAEKQFLKNPPIQKIGKLHCYPEPSGPPDDVTPPTIAKPTSYTSPVVVKPAASPLYPRDVSSNVYPSNSANVSLYQQPKYGLQTYPINPIQIQLPMAVGSDFQNCGASVLMILMNQNNLGNRYAIEEPKRPAVPLEAHTMETDREIFVQSSNKPIGQRIVNFKTPILHFNEENKIENPSDMFHETSTPNKSIAPSFPHNQSSIVDCRLPKSNLNNWNIKNQSNPIICEPKLNWTPRQAPAESPNSFNIWTQRPSPQKSSFQTNTFSKHPSAPTNAFASRVSSHSNIFSKSTSAPRKIFASSPYPNIFAPSCSADQNIFAPSPSNIFAPKSSHLGKTNTSEARQELFPLLFKEKQPKDNFQKQNNFETNLFKTTEKSTLIQSNRVDFKNPFKAQNITKSAPENNLSYCKNSKENSSSTQGNTVDNIKSNTDTNLQNLAVNDLRRILTKKRKSMDIDQAGMTEGKKIKTEIKEYPAPNPKKKVTFNLVPERISDVGTIEDSYNEHTGFNEADTAVQESRLFPSPSRSQEPWYLVVDTNVLIEELDYLDNFAKMDTKCQVIIPSRVMSDTVALSRAEGRERHRVILARHSLRRLATPPPHIIVKSTPFEETANISTEGSILNFCLEGMERNSHLILVTNDENLQSKAKYLKIPCFNIQQLKENAVKTPEVHFNIKQIKISVPNVPENIYLEKELPTHAFKNKLFDSTVETSLQEQNCNEEFNPTWKYNTKDINRDFQQLKELPRLFQNNIMTNSTQVIKRPTAPNNEIFKNVPNSKHAVSRYFQYNDVQNLPVIESRRNWENEHQTVSYFFQSESENNKIQTIPSIFKLPNDKIKRKESQNQSHASIFEIENEQPLPKEAESKSSIFEVSGIEKIKPSQVQTKPIFEDDFKSIDQQYSIFDNEKYENIQIELNNSIFGNSRTAANKEISMKPSIFESEKRKNKENQLTSPLFKNQQFKNIEVQFNNNSIFENYQLRTNQTGAKSGPTIFEHEKYKNIEVQLNNSICENTLLTIEEVQMNSPATHNDKLRYKEVQLKPPSLDKEKYENEGVGLRTIFENEKQKNKGVQLKPSIFEINEDMELLFPDDIKNGFDLEECIKQIFVQNNIKENTIEERKEEFVCSFKQIMEECLTNVLQQSSFIHKSMPPPWSLHEGLQCIAKLYGDHTTVRTVVNFLNGVLDAKGEVRGGDVAKGVGCGLLLIRYLKKLTPNTEGLTDAENALHRFIKNDTAANLDEPIKPPVFSRSDIESPEHTSRRNFVKERSEILSYLKRHYPEWTNYDETLDNTQSKPAWGQNYKYAKIVRTLGKNLSLLEINKTKTMTMNSGPNTNKSIEKHKRKDTTQSDKHNSQENANKVRIMKENDNNNNAGAATKENVDIKNANNSSDKQPKKKIEKFRNLLKLTRKLDCQPTKTENIVNSDTKSVNTEGANRNIDSKKTVPKIIRVFDNIKLSKEQIKERSGKDCGIPIFDLDYSTHGHTFGTNENTGPKMIRNVQLIEAFEKKLKNKKMALDLDQLDYSGISKSDENEYTDDCISINVDDNNEIDTNVNYEPNDNFYATNDESKRDPKKFDNNENNSQITNNCSYSMSFDNCVANDIVATNDDKNDSNKEKNNTSMNDNHFSSASFGKNDAVNDESKVHKDDTTNDSGYENDSLQAYTFVKSFLYEVSSSFKMVHKFIEESVKDLRNENLLENKRRMLHSKANAAHTQMIGIIDKLKCIITRESDDGTSLKTLLASAGSQASDDKRVTRYRQVVTKCLEQGQMLQKALRLMQSVTDDSFDCASVNTNSNSNVRYFNIFE